MKNSLLPLVTLLASLTLGQAQTTLFTYQGRLTDNGAPANGTYDLQFTLRDALAAGNPVGGPLVVAPVGVTNGLFTVPLDFGAGAFPGADRWLEIGVRTNGSAAAYTLLSPRQAVTAAPYAIRAATAATAGSAASLSSPLPATSLTGTINDARLSANVALLTGSPVFSGGITAPSFRGDGSALTGLWRLGGNTATTPGTHFLGTTDGQSLEFKVNGLRALRLEPNAAGAPNLLGGAAVNFVAPGVVGVTIAGGAANYGGIAYSNSVAANFANIGGGLVNTIQAGAINAVIGGGGNHTIQTNAYSATIGGGDSNTILANGQYGTIPGGYANAATNLAFAAGRQAKARHTGAFVWADSSFTDFVSTANDQFLIRAGGGVGIGKNNPATALDVNGTITATAFAGSGADLTGLTASSLTAGTLPSAQLSGLYNAALTFDNPANSFTGDGGGLSGLWKLDGNSGTLAGAHSLGTTDNQPLEFKVNNQRALRFEPNTNGAPNVIGGASVNFVAQGVFGATIAGGGVTNDAGGILSNSVAATFGSIGGGGGNIISNGADLGTIAGGVNNQIQNGAAGSTVAGGQLNRHYPGAHGGSIGGGELNTISSGCSFGTIAGGNDNIIFTSARGGSIGGGAVNYIGANSRFATIPGGSGNRANGTNSFAAGQFAFAMHSGSFVWSDTQGGFASTTNDQFNISAAGGVRLSDSTPALAFGTTTRQMLNLWGTNYGIGVQGNALYHRSDSDFSWFRGGTHSDTQNDPGAGGVEAMRLTGGGLTVNGTFVNASDRDAKEHFAPINAQDILAKVAALPLSQWNYKQDAATRHLGPMAQDFFAAFGVGPDDKHIATVDEGGVALAAIQGLHHLVQEKDERIHRLETDLSELQALVKKLAEQVKRVAR